MGNQESNQGEKCFSARRKLKNHIFIKDHDLQIHVPTIKDANLFHRASRFRVPFSSMTSYTDANIAENAGQESQGDDLKLAMEEAKNSYDSMMQIREQLNQAYKEFMQMQS